MRTKVFAAVLLLLVAVVAISATRSTAVREALLPERSPAEIALDRVLPEVQLEGVPFDKALGLLETEAATRLMVDWPTLDSLGFDRKAPVTLRVRGVRLSDALAEVLAQMPPPADGTPRLDFDPHGSAVLISTQMLASQRVFVRCYDVRDLVPPAEVPDPAPPGTRSGVGLIGNQAARATDEEVIYYILETVAPETWRDNGGSLGQIRYLNGRLVIAQTWRHHRNIESALAALRRPVPVSGGGVEELTWDERLRQWPPATPDPAERALRTVLPEVKLKDASLDEAVQTLARLARANIVLDGKSMMEVELERKHLENAGVDVTRSRRLTLDLYDITLERALKAVLLAFSDNLWTGGFTVQDGAIIVSSSALPRELFTRVYDLRDWPDFGAAVAAHVRPSSPMKSRSAASSPADNLQRLMDAIMTTVDPESWREHGGTGSVLAVANRLVVTQTRQNHEQVRWLLSTLRAGPAPAATHPSGDRSD